MDSLSSLLDAVLPIGLIVLGTVAAVVVLAALNGRRLRRRAERAMEGHYDIQAALLDAVKEASANRHTRVDIRPFWRKSKIPRSHRAAVVSLLERSRDVVADDQPSQAGTFWDALAGLVRTAFQLPPSHVVLTDRTWERMVHEGVSGAAIVIERVGIMNWQSQNTNGGDIVGSPQTASGRDATVRTGSIDNERGPQNLLSTDLASLVAALREDARSIPEGPERANVRALADKVEDEAGRDEPDEDKVEGMIQRARRYVSDLGGLMRATGSLLNAWQGIQNGGN